MEIILFLGLIVVIFLLISIQNRLENKIGLLSHKMDQLRSQLEHLKEGKKQEKETVVVKETLVTPKEIIVPEVKKPEPVAITPSQETIKQKAPAAIPVQRPPLTKPKEKKPGFFERNPDLEKFIGENLINKIGIGILVIGIGFFVKYAIDQDWINEIGRVFIGILCGGILVGLAHKLRKTFKAFSSVLVGGGMAVFYLTITIAFHEYYLFSQTAAFIIMVIITGFSVLLAIAYDRMELAVLAIIGGFASPFMISTGEGNYIVLFTYVAILNTGMLVLAYFRKWNLINIISYLFTVLLFGGWLASRYLEHENPPSMGAFLFATLFYLIFFLMNIINNIRENRRFIATEISILLSNTFLYYTAGMIILRQVHSGIYEGLFTALIAVFNFGFAYILYKNKKADTNLVYLLIGLVLTFLSLTAPVQLEGNYITLFWAAETVLLLWLSQKSGIRLIKLASIIVMILMYISLIMDWYQIYPLTGTLPVMLNKAFVTGISALVSIHLSRMLLKKEEALLISLFSKKDYLIILNTAFLVFLYVTGLLELTFQLYSRVEPGSFRTVIIGSYNLSFILGLMLFFHRKQGTREVKIAATLAGIATSLIFIIYYHGKIITLRNDYLYEQLASLGNYLYHYIDTGLALVILGIALKNMTSLFDLKSAQVRSFYWYLAFAVVFILSAELDHLVLLAAYTPDADPYHIISQDHKIGFPILWGLCSLILMTIGMRKKIKDLRIISLSLFSIILLKLFFFDLRDISEGGKIAAFICLGVLLLVISFMYQKLKKLVLEDESRPATQL